MCSLINNCANPGIGLPILDADQRILLKRDIDLQHIFLDDVFREKANDQEFPHFKFVEFCLKNELQFPTDLAIDVIESKINERGEGGEGDKWKVVYGLSMQDLVMFQQKVSISQLHRACLYY